MIPRAYWERRWKTDGVNAVGGAVTSSTHLHRTAPSLDAAGTYDAWYASCHSAPASPRGDVTHFAWAPWRRRSETEADSLWFDEGITPSLFTLFPRHRCATRNDDATTMEEFETPPTDEEMAVYYRRCRAADRLPWFYEWQAENPDRLAPPNLPQYNWFADIIEDAHADGWHVPGVDWGVDPQPEGALPWPTKTPPYVWPKSDDGVDRWQEEALAASRSFDGVPGWTAA